MKRLLLLFLLLVSIVAAGQRVDRKLKNKVESLIHGFDGQIGVYIHDLKKDKVVAINEDTIFTTASIVKIPILVGVMGKLEKRELQYNQELVYKDSLLYAGVDILGSFKNNEKIALSKVMMLMLTTSDNTASLWLQTLAGTGVRINELMDSVGLKDTRVNSRTPGREANRTKYGWGQTTPKEMAMLMMKIVDGQIISDSASDRMLRLLGRNYWDENAVSQIPSDVFVASKNGAVNPSRNEILFVNGRGRRYIFSVFTQNNKDISWKESNEAWMLTRKLSKLVWDWFD